MAENLPKWGDKQSFAQFIQDSVTGVMERMKGTNGAALAGIVSISKTTFAQRKLTGLTNVWPGNDTFSFTFEEQDDVRMFRFRAVKTAGATAGATLKYTLDAPSAVDAGSALAYVPVSANIEDLPYQELFDGQWSEWFELSRDPNLLPLQRVDFLATADTWTVHLEKA